MAELAGEGGGATEEEEGEEEEEEEKVSWRCVAVWSFT